MRWLALCCLLPGCYDFINGEVDGDMAFITTTGPNPYAHFPGPWTIQVELSGAMCNDPVHFTWRSTNGHGAGAEILECCCPMFTAEVPPLPVGARFTWSVRYKEFRSEDEPFEVTVIDPDDFIFLE